MGPCSSAGRWGSQGGLPGQRGFACQLHSSHKYLSQAGQGIQLWKRRTLSVPPLSSWGLGRQLQMEEQPTSVLPPPRSCLAEAGPGGHPGERGTATRKDGFVCGGWAEAQLPQLTWAARDLREGTESIRDLKLCSLGCTSEGTATTGVGEMRQTTQLWQMKSWPAVER